MKACAASSLVTAADVQYSLTRASGPKSLYGLLYPIKTIDAPGASGSDRCTRPMIVSGRAAPA